MMMKKLLLTPILLITLLVSSCEDESPQPIVADAILEHLPPIVRGDDVTLIWDTRKSNTPAGFITGKRLITNNIGTGDRIVETRGYTFTKRRIAQIVGKVNTMTLMVWIDGVSTALGTQGLAQAQASYTFFIDRDNLNEFGVIIVDSENNTFRYLL